MGKKNRKQAGRRLAQRASVRQRLKIERGEFDPTVVWVRAAPASSARPAARATAHPRCMEVARRVGLSGSATRAFCDLAEAVRRSKLLDADERVCAHLPRGVANTYLGGLAALASRHRQWVRDPAEWRRDTHNAERQFAGLARYLMARYPVPRFLDEAWFNDWSAPRRWYVAMAQGRSLRRMEMPLPMTRRMLHAFTQAPSDLTIQQALRWSQVRAMGGDERLARLLVQTFLGRRFEHEEFWADVVRFFVGEPGLPAHEYVQIVDYLHHQRFVGGGEAVVNGRLVDLAPPEPNLSMRGRSLRALRRAVVRWHRELYAVGPHCRWSLDTTWDPSGVRGVEQREGSGAKARVWAVRELLIGRDLFTEGRRMRHCVGTYVGDCVSGRAAIFSMVCSDDTGALEPALTIEVDPKTRRVLQARGRANRMPDAVERRRLQAWASIAGLTIAYC